MGEGTVQIHLVLHEQNEELSVDFPFNRFTDDMDHVVADLVETLGMAEREHLQIRALIEAQVFGQSPTTSHGITPFFEPIDPPEEYHSDDDDCISDPEYFDLLSRQRAEIDQLKAEQIRERRKLAAELNSFSPPIPARVNSADSTVVPGGPRVGSPGSIELGFASSQGPLPNPPAPTVNPPQAGGTVDDLIVF
jgi:hypothetical protein